MTVDPDSMERLVPDEIRDQGVVGQETLRLHLQRYRFAAGHLRPGRFMDVACGVGYGTRYLLTEGPRPLKGVGVDISEEAVAYAREHYGGDARLRFVVSDAMALRGRVDIAPASFETIVSLETLEHLPDPRRFIETVGPLLRPGGTWVASVPVTPTKDANPYHLHDFTEESFLRLFDGHDLVEVGRLEQTQRYSPIGLLASKGRGRTEDLRRHLASWYLSHPTYALRRAWSMLTEGFQNRYLTVALTAPSSHLE